MDPLACLNRAWSLYYSDDFRGARAALRDYRQWRERGGFEPRTESGGGDESAQVLRRTLWRQSRGLL